MWLCCFAVCNEAAHFCGKVRIKDIQSIKVVFVVPPEVTFKTVKVPLSQRDLSCGLLSVDGEISISCPAQGE
jgi:hypothetical protein